MSDGRLHNIDFYLVTDSGLSRNGTLHDVEEAVRAGCRIVQYREKSKSTREMIDEAKQIKDLCRDKAVFLVNDRVDVALAVDADGVHIGMDDMPFAVARRLLGEEKIIGLTVHNVEESIEAERLGADYIGLSPIYETATKQDAGRGCGTKMIEAVRKQASLPIVAIGGINRKNVEAVIQAGADSAVAISAVVCTEDVYSEAREFIRMIRKAQGIRHKR